MDSRPDQGKHGGTTGKEAETGIALATTSPDLQKSTSTPTFIHATMALLLSALARSPRSYVVKMYIGRRSAATRSIKVREVNDGLRFRGGNSCAKGRLIRSGSLHLARTKKLKVKSLQVVRCDRRV